MARLTYVFRNEDKNYVNIGRRQLPMIASDNLMMLMDLNSKGLCIDSPQIRGKELEEFTRKFKLLNIFELHKSLEIDSATFLSVLNQCVQCVGCRRRVERLFNQLTSSGHATLDPLVINNNKVLTINEDRLRSPQALGTILYRHHDVLNNLLDSKLRNKTRCALHSLDAFRSKPFSETWREVWSSMKHNCRDELAVIETKELEEVLENYLKKHKFCQGCRTKIEKAYKILIGESTTKEKGYVAALYANIKKCHPDKHIHVYINKIDFLDALIRRAEPEVNGSYSKLRERHAKTLEIAQEEVLTCVGMIMYERLRRIYVSFREEERACQVLAAVGVHALSRSFDMFVEKKQGISNLELLYQEISRAEKAKEHKREQKKLKKKKKKNEKKNSHRNCETVGDEDEEQAAVDGDVDEAADLADDEGESPQTSAALNGESDSTTRIECNERNDDEDDNVPKDFDECEVGGRHGSSITAPPSPAFQLASKKRKKQKNRKQQQNKSKTSLQQQPRSRQSSDQQMNLEELSRECKQSSRESSIGSQRRTTHSSSCSTTSPSVPQSPVRGAPKCNGCLADKLSCPCENDVRDSGYGSEQSNSRLQSELSSTEGSEVSCSDGFCNHENELGTQHCHGNMVKHKREANATSGKRPDDISGNHLLSSDSGVYCKDSFQKNCSLQEMLEASDVCAGDTDDEEIFNIPQEVLLEYQCKRERVEKQREQLRESLRQNFERLCKQRALTPRPDCEQQAQMQYACHHQ